MAATCEPAALDWADVCTSLAGDEQAYARLVRRYQDPIAAYMRRFTRDRRQWEELVHDVFVDAYLGLASYSGRAPLLHWLKRIGTRVGYRYWKARQRRRREVDLPDDAGQTASAAEGIDSARHAAEVVHLLLAQLAPRNRLVLTLIYLESHSLAEAAQLTGWSETMVKVQAHCAASAWRRSVPKEESNYESPSRPFRDLGPPGRPGAAAADRRGESSGREHRAACAATHARLVDMVGCGLVACGGAGGADTGRAPRRRVRRPLGTLAAFPGTGDAMSDLSPSASEVRHPPAAVPPRRRLWVRVLLSLIIFVSGGVAGGGIALLAVRDRVLHAIHHPEEMPAVIAGRIRRALHLSDAQAQEAEKILVRRQRAIQAIRRQFQPQVEAELDRFDEEMSAALDDRQRDLARRFQTLARRMDSPAAAGAERPCRRGVR